ncbi:winged helix-turn-helix domain-containing protein [Halotalea alkalilenta]|uniref:winged helix-turn-helix domain-containing protein n=1 Tax=Halotalea alkalilenta TaxID=376489 RepID=UPI0005B7B4C2|nr:LysR family transcriptional regulator [Halotalea alkalilenta]
MVEGRATNTPRLRIRLSLSDELTLGSGKMDLLEAIERHGSISAASRSMGLSYKKAWQLVETMNRCLVEPVVVTSSGGHQRGGARLTPFGIALLARLRALSLHLDEVARDELDALGKLLKPAQT